MRYLLFAPALFCFLCGLIGAVSRSMKEDAERRRMEERREAKRRAAEQAEAERKARKAAAAEKKAAQAAQPPKKRGRPRKNPEPVEKKPEPQPEPLRPATISDALTGQTFSFTGTLDGMTRRQAIEAVQQRGGKAFDTMPAGTTILVVGSNPGMNKLDKADRWIGSVRKITQAQFFAMLSATEEKAAAPAALTLDEFAARFAA